MGHLPLAADMGTSNETQGGSASLAMTT